MSNLWWTLSTHYRCRTVGAVTHDSILGAVWPAGGSLRAAVQPLPSGIPAFPALCRAVAQLGVGDPFPLWQGQPCGQAHPSLPSPPLPLAAFELLLGPRPKQDNVWAGWTLFFKVFFVFIFPCMDSGPHHPSGPFPEAQNSTICWRKRERITPRESQDQRTT